jgi:hypothetical protein
MWFLAYLIPTIWLLVGFAWMVGANRADPPEDGAIYLVLFFSIIFWPVMAAMLLATVPFILISQLAHSRIKSKGPTP